MKNKIIVNLHRNEIVLKKEDGSEDIIVLEDQNLQLNTNDDIKKLIKNYPTVLMLISENIIESDITVIRD